MCHIKVLCSFHTEKRQASILDGLDSTNVTIIGVTCGLVIILLTVSIIIQIKQPRKKYIIRRDEFDPTLLHEALEPPHYELCTLRQATSFDGDVLPEEFPNLQRTSSKCIYGHHCGSQVSSTRGSRSDLSLRDAAAVLSEMEPTIQPPFPLQATPNGRRNILVMKHSYSHDGAEECDLDDEFYDGPTTSRGRAVMDRTVHRSVSIDFWWFSMHVSSAYWIDYFLHSPFCLCFICNSHALVYYVCWQTKCPCSHSIFTVLYP